MDATGYIVVFDVSTQPFTHWIWATPAFILGIVAILLPRFVKGWEARCAGLFLVTLSVAVAVGMIGLLWFDYQRLRGAYARGDYRIVEGRVEAFVPDSAQGKGPQTFVVNGVKFRISTLGLNASFRDTVGRGGPNLVGRCVRVAYVTTEEIIWLGIRSQGC